METERERTFLLREKPKGLNRVKSLEIFDIYLPTKEKHPILRIRKAGKKYTFTKKKPLFKGDASIQGEETIILSKKEYEELIKIKGRRLRKIRYYYPFKKRVAEIDIYLDKLKGLAMVDFEFKNKKEKANFSIPDFCLVEVTQNAEIAGGILAGKGYKEIKSFLDKYSYQKIK